MPRYHVELGRKVTTYATTVIEAATYAQAESMALDDARAEKLTFGDKTGGETYIIDTVDLADPQDPYAALLRTSEAAKARAKI